MCYLASNQFMNLGIFNSNTDFISCVSLLWAHKVCKLALYVCVYIYIYVAIILLSFRLSYIAIDFKHSIMLMNVYKVTNCHAISVVIKLNWDRENLTKVTTRKYTQLICGGKQHKNPCGNKMTQRFSCVDKWLWDTYYK